MPDIEVLIQRWQNGDEHAAEALYNHHREPIYRLAYGLLGDPADAEEAAQDALTYALVHIARYNPQRARFTTWLHTITVSRCRDRQRRRRLSSISLTAWLERGESLPAPVAEPERHVIQQEASSEVWTAIQALNPRQREAILLRYWAGHTYQEMAKIMNCPLPTAQSRLRLAYQRLRTALTSTEEFAWEEDTLEGDAE
jgi:RNA polymerase sigma-70 factor (ECF subfamily)